MDNPATLFALFIGQPKTITDARGTWRTSIFRDQVTGPAQVHELGLAGDRAAQPYHGGPDGAICVHLLDHYLFWQERYGFDIQPGGVGENFTLDNLRDDQVCAGDIVRVGTALLQVSGPRVPCVNQARRVGRPDWIKLTVRENRTGFYLRVLETGTVLPGDAWNLQERLNPAGTITALNHCAYLDFDPAYAELTLQMPGLSDWWKDQMLERAEQRARHWTAGMKDNSGVEPAPAESA